MTGPVRIPDEAAPGKATITFSIPDWKGGKVAPPATYEVLIVEPEPKGPPARKSELKETKTEQNADEATTKQVAQLIHELQQEKAHVRQRAAKALSKLGPKAKGAVPVLREVLKDKDKAARILAARALMNIDPEKRTDLVPVLVELMQVPAHGR